jgi:hypothetical protein
MGGQTGQARSGQAEEVQPPVFGRGVSRSSELGSLQPMFVWLHELWAIAQMQQLSTPFWSN